MPELFHAEDAIGTVHCSRFTILDEKTLLFLGDADGEFGALMTDFANHVGPLFDSIFQNVENPPHTPVADNVNAFVEWTSEHFLQAVTLFSAYPDVTAKEIKALAAAAGVKGAGTQHPFLVILPIKSSLAYVEMQLFLRVREHRTQRDLAMVGTPHFAQFVPLGEDRVGFFTVFDSSFDMYIKDFTRHIGPVFDLIFKLTKDPPPSPCEKYVHEFIHFATEANRAPIGFYQANPGLTVEDINALIADSKSPSGSAQ